MAAQSKEARRQQMLTAPLLPLILKMAVPTMVGMMVSVIYNLTDTFWVGRLHDKGMTAAVGVVFSFVSLVQALGFWYGYGSGNGMSRALGAGDDAEAEQLSAGGVTLALGTGLLLTAGCLPLARPLAAFLGGSASAQLLEYTTAYLRILLPAVPFSLFSTTVYNQFRLCGNGKDAMTGLLLGMAANMLLDPVLILWLRMSVAGAAWATFAGQALSCLYFAVCSRRHGNTPARVRPAALRGGRLCSILAGGAPNFTRQGVTGLASMLLNQAAARYGETVLAALAISSRTAAIGYMLMIGFGQGFQPVCAMNFGAQQYGRVKKAFRLTVKTATGLLLAAAALLAVSASRLAGLFTADAEVAALAAHLLRLQCLSLPFLGFYAVSSMYMQNIGQYLRSLLISVARQGFFYLPLLYLLPALWGQDGLYWVQPAADVLSFGFAAAVLWAGRSSSP